MCDCFCSFTPYQCNATSLNAASHHNVVQKSLVITADVNIATSDVSDMNQIGLITDVGSCNKGYGGGEANCLKPYK